MKYIIEQLGQILYGRPPLVSECLGGEEKIIYDAVDEIIELRGKVSVLEHTVKLLVDDHKLGPSQGMQGIASGER